MGFFDRKPRTKEQAGQMRVNMRILACIALGYFAVQMLQSAPEDDGMSPALKITIAIAFLLFAVVVGLQSVREYFRMQKAAKDKANEEASAEAEQLEEAAADDDEYEYDEEYEDDEDDEDSEKE